MFTVGILALQGNYHSHQKTLNKLKVSSKLIKNALELRSIDALIIPGGESTTMKKLMGDTEFEKEIRALHGSGKPLLGTCAGLILLGKNSDSDPRSLELIDVTVQRNAYGRQQDSFITHESLLGRDFFKKEPCVEMVFIRAPKIISAGINVGVLAKVNGEIVMAEQGNVLVTSFHPELSESLLIHSYFLSKAGFSHSFSRSL